MFSSTGRRVMSALVFCAGFCYNLPRFFDSCVMKFHDPCTGTTIARRVYAPRFNDPLYFDIYQNASYILFLFVIPLGLLLTLNCRLIRAIQHSKRRFREMTATGRCNNSLVSSSSLQSASGARRFVLHHEHNATLVLIIIVVVFIVCETPELIFRVITFVESKWQQLDMTFSGAFRHTFSTISELLMIINSSINFVIYCAFGRRFRTVMKYTFTPNGSTLVTHETIPLQHQLQNPQG